MTFLLRLHKPLTASVLLLALAGCTSSRFADKPDRGNGVTAASVVPGNLSRTAQIAQLQIDAAAVYAQMIEYFTPGEQTVPMVAVSAAPRPLATRRLEAFLRFKPGSSDLLPAYSGNRAELARIHHELVALAGGETTSIQRIRISGYASPDGNTRRNEELAAARALRYRGYLEKELRLQNKAMLQVDLCAEDWEGLARLAAETSKPYAARVAAVLDSVTDPDARRKALRALNKGAAWRDMEKTLFARLRRMQLDVAYRVPAEQPDAAQPASIAQPATPPLAALLQRFDTEPDALTLDELTQAATAFRPGTEQYREVYELAAYRFPDDTVAQLNAAAAALAQSDTEAARYFLTRVADDSRAWINQGVLALMEGDKAGAADWFRKAMPRKPRLARENMRIIEN